MMGMLTRSPCSAYSYFAIWKRNFPGFFATAVLAWLATTESVAMPSGIAISLASSPLAESPQRPQDLDYLRTLIINY
jgi:amino acid transporter